MSTRFQDWPLELLEWVYVLAMSQDLKIVHAGTTGAEIRIEMNRPLDPVEQEELRVLQGHTPWVRVDSSAMGAPRALVGGHMTASVAAPFQTLAFRDPWNPEETKQRLDQVRGFVDELNSRRRIREKGEQETRERVEAGERAAELQREETAAVIDDWLKQK